MLYIPVSPVSRLLLPLRPFVIGHAMNLHWKSSSSPATPAPAGALSKLVRIDNQMHHIELSLQKWMDSLWRGHVLTHHAPFEPERPGPWDTEIEMDFTNLIEPEIVKEGNDVKYRMSVNMGDDIPPENVWMTLKDRKMKIHVKLDEVEDETTKTHHHPGTYREVISRPFALPRHIDENSVRSVMGPHGLFQIEILIPKKVIHDIEKAHQQKSKPFHVGME